MKLSTKFLFLIVGSIITPLLALLAVYSLTNEGRREWEVLDRFERNLQKERLSQKQLENILKRTDRIDFILFDDNGKVILGNDKKIRRERDAIIRSIPLTMDNGDHFQLVITRPLMRMGPPSTPPHRPGIPQQKSVINPLAVTLSVTALFVIVMSLLIILSINRNIGAMEKATGKIAQGDLDFEVKARSRDRLGSLAESINSMRLKIKEEYERRSRFMLGVSHDLKTPLASINGYAEAIRDEKGRDEERYSLYPKIIIEKTTQLEDRILHLIDYLKMDTGEWRNSRRAITLKSLLNDIARDAEMEAKIRERTLTVSVGIDEEFTIMADGVLVERALENILVNAFEHTPANATINFIAEKTENGAEITIRDEGSGIPDDDLEKIFEPFYVGKAKKARRNSGLGLSTAALIIRNHGWKITVESCEGKGSSFRIFVPHGDKDGRVTG